MTDFEIAQKYVSKGQHAKTNGHAFTISFTSFKNMMRAKKCQYTGIVLTNPESGRNSKATDRTIDRIDSSKGYVPGNVVAICNAANQFKSLFENSEYLITTKMARKIVDVIDAASKSNGI